MTVVIPVISLVVPCYNSDPRYLDEAIRSVRTQTYADWELIIVDDASSDTRSHSVIESHAAEDARIRVIMRAQNAGISAASNDALAIVRGDYVGFLDHDDLLAPGALRKVAAYLVDHPGTDLIYSDEDKVDDDGEYFDVFAKPVWSPERLRGQMYTGHLSVYRTELVRELGGLRSQFDGSQDHDLALRVSERTDRILHLPEVLYHWRVHPESTASGGDAKPYAWDAGLGAVAEHVARTHTGVGVEYGPWPGTYRVVRELDPAVRVSLVIPTRGGSSVVRGVERVLVVEAVRSVLATTGHDNLEIVVVYDTATPDTVLDALRAVAGDKLVAVEYTAPFNFSEKCNVGAVASTGEYLIMFNDDIEAISGDAITELCAPLAQSDVGLTGAYLVFEDGHVQHAGHFYGNRGYGHPFQDLELGESGPFAALDIDREVTGVTAACAALRREVYFEVGGFTEALPGNFNDVDFCNKIRRAGYRILFMSHARLHHFESQTRIPIVEQFEMDVIRGRWGIPDRDDYLPVADEPKTVLERASA